MKRDSKVIGAATGALLSVLLTAVAVGLLLSGTWLYGIEIDALGISESSGLAREEVLANYNAVIDYLSPFNSGEFSMPSLAASENGVRHFEDVKALVGGVYLAGLASLVLFAAILIFARKNIGPKTFLSASVTTFAFPLLIAAGIAADFDRFFVIFHKLFFSNDYWIFNPFADPVITILPSAYFMHCALIIALFWLCGGAALLSVYFRLKKIRKPEAPPRRLGFGK